MFNILVQLTQTKNKVDILRRNFTVMIVFSVLYYLSHYISKYLEYDIIEEEFNIFKCLHFSLITQAGIGYGYVYDTKNPVQFYVNLLHVCVVFILTMGLV